MGQIRRSKWAKLEERTQAVFIGVSFGAIGLISMAARARFEAIRAEEKAMLDYLDQRNENPKPFVWTADADLILGKIQRLSKRISHSGH